MVRETATNPARIKPVRCTVYTRVSPAARGVEGPDSLNAQRDACEVYIRTRAHEGWVLVEGTFEDDGHSSAVQDRPGLSRLMARVREGAIDAVVVTKVDRVTRSFPVLAQVLTEFEVSGVAFAVVGLGVATPQLLDLARFFAMLEFEQVPHGK